MLLPQILLRRLWLTRCWRDYPRYDPPHKREERLLSREAAAENFEYFMAVRRPRDDYFRAWIKSHFGIIITSNEEGMRQLNRWASKYGAVLVIYDPTCPPPLTYFTYDPPWVEEYTGYNIIFDMGISLGESIIANCPGVRWDFDPISASFPHIAKQLKQGASTSFQRAMLTGFANPACNPMPLHKVYLFVHQIAKYATTFGGLMEHYDKPRRIRGLIRDGLLNEFKGILKSYRISDPHELWREMEPKEFLKLVDLDAEAGRSGDE